MWREKLSYMIVRSVFNIKELKKLEAEEAVRVEGTGRSLVEGSFIAIYELIDIRDRYHSNL